jgi:hypothetical protein
MKKNGTITPMLHLPAPVNWQVRLALKSIHCMSWRSIQPPQSLKPQKNCATT